MIQVIKQSHEEKVKMYSKLKKSELINMLIQANIHLSLVKPTMKLCNFYMSGNDTSAKCINCGRDKWSHD